MVMKCSYPGSHSSVVVVCTYAIATISVKTTYRGVTMKIMTPLMAIIPTGAIKANITLAPWLERSQAF